jgi:hypothetical protein
MLEYRRGDEEIRCAYLGLNDMWVEWPIAEADMCYGVVRALVSLSEKDIDDEGLFNHALSFLVFASDFQSPLLGAMLGMTCGALFKSLALGYLLAGLVADQIIEDYDKRIDRIGTWLMRGIEPPTVEDIVSMMRDAMATGDAVLGFAAGAASTVLLNRCQVLYRYTEPKDAMFVFRMDKKEE